MPSPSHRDARFASTVHWMPRWRWLGVAEDFGRVQILLTVFDGDPDKWLELIRTSGTQADQADVPFLLELKARLAEEPDVIEDMRRIVRMFREKVNRQTTEAEETGSVERVVGGKDAVVIESSNASVLSAVKDFAQTVEQEMQADETMVETLASLPVAPRAEHLEQLRRNAELRRRFMKEVPLLKSADVAKLSGSVARNVSARANRWKTERRIFSVSDGGVDHYPGFQFNADGEPVAAMRDVLDVFKDLSEWQIALWFFTPDAWLDGKVPMDVLQRDAQAVIAAARHFVEPIEG